MNYNNKDAGQKQEETGGFCKALAGCVCTGCMNRAEKTLLQKSSGKFSNKG
ncbi:hypothetical protein [Faecalibacterium prausnitzii]|uniref:hypothetical protein n=1 Tax=Faecalibacterium prausnitzii TaxID=853 RepID=UPI003F1C2747